MINYGTNANSGYLEPDRSDTQGSLNPYAKGGGSAAIDYDTVKNYLIQVLVSNGLSISQVPTSTLDQLVQQFANDPDFQQMYGSASNLSTSLYPSTSTITGFIQNQLFDPGLSSNSNFLSSGLLLMSNQGKPLSSAQQGALGSIGGTVIQPFDMSKYPRELTWGDSNGFMAIKW